MLFIWKSTNQEPSTIHNYYSNSNWTFATCERDKALFVPDDQPLTLTCTLAHRSAQFALGRRGALVFSVRVDPRAAIHENWALAVMVHTAMELEVSCPAGGQKILFKISYIPKICDQDRCFVLSISRDIRSRHL